MAVQGEGTAKAQGEPSRSKEAATVTTRAAGSVESWDIGQVIVLRRNRETPAGWKQEHRSGQRLPGPTQANVQECSIRCCANKRHSMTADTGAEHTFVARGMVPADILGPAKMMCGVADHCLQLKGPKKGKLGGWPGGSTAGVCDRPERGLPPRC